VVGSSHVHHPCFGECCRRVVSFVSLAISSSSFLPLFRGAASCPMCSVVSSPSFSGICSLICCRRIQLFFGLPFGRCVLPLFVFIVSSSPSSRACLPRRVWLLPPVFFCPCPLCRFLAPRFAYAPSGYGPQMRRTGRVSAMRYAMLCAMLCYALRISWPQEPRIPLSIYGHNKLPRQTTQTHTQQTHKQQQPVGSLLSLI
jgi:hypothetical protein